MTTNSQNDSVVLKRALLGNAIFSASSGTLMLLFAASLTPHLGGTPVLAVRAVGASLVLFAVALLWQANQEPPPLIFARTTVIADVGWVIGTAAALAAYGSQLSSVGLALVLGVAAVVTTAAILQAVGIRRLRLSMEGG